MNEGMVSGSAVRGQAGSVRRLCTLAISCNLLGRARRRLPDHLVGRVSQVLDGVHWELVPARWCVARGPSGSLYEEEGHYCHHSPNIS